MLDYMIQALGDIANFQTILLIVIGAAFGILSGAIPGLTITMGIILIFPFTFALDQLNGIALMIGVMVGGYSGGLIAGIMLGIPGTPSSIVTTFDGYPMNKKGEASRALGIGILSSLFGLLISVSILIFMAPIVARFSLNFGPWEISALILLALTLVSSLSQGATVKGLIVAGIGLLIATVGIDASGLPRFNFGQYQLNNGFSVLPVLIGVFAFSQLLKDTMKLKENKELAQIKQKISIPYRQIIKDMWTERWNVLRSSFIGNIIGSLPGTGGDIANFVSYDQAKKFSKHPEKFGKGTPGGVVAGETSNSAVAGGVFIPTLILGIPGDMIMAVMMGVLILHGITPGPLLFQQQGLLVASIYVTLILAGIVVLIVQILFLRSFIRVINIPQTILIPLVFALCIVGAYALNNTLFDIWTLFIFGVIGFLLSYFGAPLSPLILGVILGENFETHIYRALELDSWTTFFTRPISLVLILIVILSIIITSIQNRKYAKKFQSKPDK